MARFTICQPACTEPPEQFISPPDENEAMVTPPKTTRSFRPCKRPLTAGRWAVVAGRLLGVTGKLQREAGVVHVVAEVIEDLSHMLDRLLEPGFRYDGVRAGDQP